MARRIEHLTTASWPADRVHHALVDPTYLRDRLAAIGGVGAELVAHNAANGTVAYQLRQGVPAAELPSMARSFLGGDLVIKRVETWRTAGDGYEGTFEATINGVPGEVTGTMSLADTGSGGSELALRGQARVGIPLVGGKFEELIVEQVGKLLDKEAAFTMSWLAEHPS
ncbi:DUF2505 domain-containing protein [Solihabitans fulvus]|uniref:DUF2505 domain-containing protein n=1 Tax=Solihabitans fulvus TaxID=1892852 RepID=A0A5B2XPR9_9PSEU|nr:DUF2505 domain-containing protein [Solihabitans fulvus]KAA2264881.1 DUF2505 domain-containing protein [Solihabitans fulvus]